MKKISMICFVIWLSICPIHAESYCIMNDGKVYDEKEMHKQQSVASISKIMTAMLAIEHGNLEDTWKTSKSILESEGSSLYLKVDQQVSMRSLLYGLMLRSGNDAALEIATHVSGDVEEFVDKMNQKAKELGMKNTLFRNPSGLDEEDGGNLSTAYDMALLASYAMKNPVFQEITGSKYYTCEWNMRWKNKNRLLFDYSNTTGGKTGFTKKAGRTLVTTATKEGMNSIVVSLDMQNDFTFHKDAHEEVFTSHTPFTLLKAGDYSVDGYRLHIEKDVILSLLKDENNAIDVKSKREGLRYEIEVTLNGISNSYSYDLEKVDKGGWSL